MLSLQRICSLDFINTVLREGADVDEVVETLVLKAEEEAKNVDSLQELEGEAIEDGEIRILKECPMVPILDMVRKENLVRTGREELPMFYQDIVERFIEQNPGEGAILHPICIVHQAMRDIIGSEKGALTRQIACRSTSSGKVVVSRNGLSIANLTEHQARDAIDGYACMYIIRKLESGEDLQ
ncbi:MAG: hypothetical protein HYX88_01040 [Chloroflexi bacterium]|nr:hypothetical protein [Chloroflexota bacterium]